MNQELKLDIANNMLKYGGSFVKCLASCIMHADAQNLRKIEMLFPEYLENYHPKNWSTNNTRAIDSFSLMLNRAYDKRVYEITKILEKHFLDKEYPSKPEFSADGKAELKFLLSKDLF